MITAWMLYCALCTLLLSLAAWLAERALLRGRGPVRLVWTLAVLLSLAVPAVALRFAPRLPVAPSTVAIGPEIALPREMPGMPVAEQASPAVVVPALAPRRDWLQTMARFDGVLVVVWMILSAAVAFNVFGGIIALSWMRRRWQRRTVLGVPVFVSEKTGPAVVGAVAPAIVLPEWALALDPSKLALMLRHEQEHRQAGDGRLLTAAQLAVIAMPWNAALWWQLNRLRAAVELDCDARVLQGADARSYADLLLEVARPRRGLRLTGATAFAERATQLERRIRVLSRHRVAVSGLSRAVATSIGLVTLTAAWVAPRPPVPARAPEPARVVADAVAPAPEPLPAPLVRGESAEPSVTPSRPRGRARPASPRVSHARQERGGQDVSRAVDSIYRHLFDGIALNRDQETRARGLLSDLHRHQLIQDREGPARFKLDIERKVRLESERNAALRELVTGDADRAVFDARIRQRALDLDAPPLPVTDPGFYGRQVTLGLSTKLDSVRLGRRGGAGVQADSLVRWMVRDSLGRRYRTTDSLRAVRWDNPTVELAVRTRLNEVSLSLAGISGDAGFRRLFNGITLTAEQETRARELIRNTQRELQIVPGRRPDILRLRPLSERVSMGAESQSAFLAIVTTEADRETLRSRTLVSRQ